MEDPAAARPDAVHSDAVHSDAVHSDAVHPDPVHPDPVHPYPVHSHSSVSDPVDSDPVQDYIEAIAPAHRPVFDRINRLVLESYPDAELLISYKMPTYRVGDNRLYVGAWKNWVAIYGLDASRDGGFAGRHPELRTSKGTIQLRPDAAAMIPDSELRDLIRAALER
jgi:uncharacterized protein YdhG (YjbR/CyaY superfamily)